MDLPTGQVLKEQSSPEFDSHVRKLQNELKELGYYKGTLDGKFGPLTHDSVTRFQKEEGLTVDGIVGQDTAKALNIKLGGQKQKPEPSPIGDDRKDDVSVNSPLPRSPSGVYSYQPQGRQYGRKSMVDEFLQIGQRWGQLHPDGPRIGAGDISKQGGGEFPPHKSHRSGVDIDIRPVRSDRKESPTRFDSPEYSRDLTRQLAETIRNAGHVQYIFFNDPQLISEKITSHCDGHDDHLHVRFRF